MRPVVMPPNRLAHFYLGGEAITRLRQVPAPADRSPEEWLASTTTRHGDASIGLSSLPDGRLLRDAVQAEPELWTGRPTSAGGPGDVGVLVKLLDAGQRLPVHVHPSRTFATDHLGSCYGKTEAWYVVETADPSAQVFLGFREDLSADDLLRAVEAQDSDWMLERMHAIPVQPGDVVLVPAETAHAIGAGIFLVEIQEPSDFSLLLEWTGFATVDDAFLGLDQDRWVSMVQHSATSADSVAALSRHVDLQRRSGELIPLLPPAADRSSVLTCSPRLPTAPCMSRPASLSWSLLPVRTADLLRRRPRTVVGRRARRAACHRRLAGAGRRHGCAVPSCLAR
jgi:mannose-6-phosphate isomerase